MTEGVEIDFTLDTEYQMMVKNGMIDFTQDSEYRRLYESESNEKTMEGKGGDTCSTEEGRQNSEKNKC